MVVLITEPGLLLYLTSPMSTSSPLFRVARCVFYTCLLWRLLDLSSLVSTLPIYFSVYCTCLLWCLLYLGSPVYTELCCTWVLAPALPDCVASASPFEGGRRWPWLCRRRWRWGSISGPGRPCSQRWQMSYSLHSHSLWSRGVPWWQSVVRH